MGTPEGGGAGLERWAGLPPEDEEERGEGLEQMSYCGKMKCMHLVDNWENTKHLRKSR